MAHTDKLKVSTFSVQDTFCWSKGDGNTSEWVGFLGYEMNRAGNVRLRRSNVEKLFQKMKKQYYASIRMMDNPNTDMKQLMEYIGRALESQSKSLAFYTGLSDNPQINKQLRWLEQRRLYFIQKSCEHVQHAKCTVNKAAKSDLRNLIRSFMADEYGFKNFFTEIVKRNMDKLCSYAN